MRNMEDYLHVKNARNVFTTGPYPNETLDAPTIFKLNPHTRFTTAPDPAVYPLTEPWSNAIMIWRWNRMKTMRVGTRISIVPAHSRGTLFA